MQLPKHMMPIFTTWELYKTPVCLRLEGNVPLNGSTIVDDYRLLRSSKTLDALKAGGAITIVLTHIGRPQGVYTEALSTMNLMPWFRDHGYQVMYAATPAELALRIRQASPGSFILLENLRFFPGEVTSCKEFAASLACHARYFIQDAFGSIHRASASMAVVPELFPISHRSIGFLVAEECNALNRVLDRPKRPFVVILGGGKASEKAVYMQDLCQIIDTLLLCPRVTSDTHVLTVLGQCMQQHGGTMLLPVDLLYDKDISQRIVGIGPDTMRLYKQHIEHAGTIVYNGMMGFLQSPETVRSTEELIRMIAASPAYTILGGGETIAVARHMNCSIPISFCSTGGGAMLAYVSRCELPGLQAFSI